MHYITVYIIFRLVDLVECNFGLSVFVVLPSKVIYQRDERAKGTFFNGCNHFSML